jgi:hypothetical protein
MNVKGLLKTKGVVVQVSDNFSKRDFVVTIDHDKEYPQVIQFQLTQARIELIDKIPLGVEVDVHFNLRGREYQDQRTGETKVFTTLDCWRIDITAHGRSQMPKASQPQASSNKNDSDSLPF